MKKNSLARLIKMLFSLVLLVSLLAPAFGALAGTSTGSGSDLLNRLRTSRDFKFYIHKDGIGYGDCPVYTAPSYDAYRCANGKATCSTNFEMDDAGFVDGWLLVRYKTNSGGVRVGYIPPRYVRGYTSPMSSPKLDAIPAEAADTILVTDNPLSPGSSFARLDPGESFYVLGKYTYFGNWWYIQCTVDGQVARGFIDRDVSAFYVDGILIPDDYGRPEISPLGTGYIGEVYVLYGDQGDRKIVRQQPSTNAKQVTVAYPGTHYPCYAEQTGSTEKPWYYIWIDEDSTWGWISSGVSTLQR